MVSKIDLASLPLRESRASTRSYTQRRYQAVAECAFGGGASWGDNSPANPPASPAMRMGGKSGLGRLPKFPV